MDHMLQKAIALAHQAHEGQVDKAGKPYISHPLRVMQQLSTMPDKIVGVLHDAVEDSELTLTDLRAAGFSEDLITAVDAITKRTTEEYEAYLQRVMANAIALRVKIADMTDNMDLTRIEAPTAKDHARLHKYKLTLPRLQQALEQN